MCEIHIAWPTDRLVLYMEGGEQPLAVEVLGQNVNGMEGEVVEGGNVEYNDNCNDPRKSTSHICAIPQKD